MNSGSTPPLAMLDHEDEEAIQTALAAIAAPGSFFNGHERLALAAHVRVARGLATTAPDLPPMLATTAARIGIEAITTRPEHITAWEADGRDVFAYLELVAVAALITSIDSYRIGVGAPLDQLPAATPGEPVPVVATDAKKMNAWVPTVGIALAPTALSALPNEKANKDRVNKTFYLSDEFVHKYGTEPGRELSRPQMELVAARTSWLNECFF